MKQEPRDPQAPLDRRDGMRRVRHVSNWTAAALIAATAVTTGYLARGSLSTGTASTARQASTASTQAPGTHKSCITVPVATSGGSGVTRQAPVTTCRPGAGGSAPAVVYVTRPANSGDN
jgi:hypothetical protein